MMAERTTITLGKDLSRRVDRLLEESNGRLNPLVNELLEDWAKEQEAHLYREQLRRRFHEALALEPEARTEHELEAEWSEVDDESVRSLDALG